MKLDRYLRKPRRGKGIEGRLRLKRSSLAYLTVVVAAVVEISVAIFLLVAVGIIGHREAKLRSAFRRMANITQDEIEASPCMPTMHEVYFFDNTKSSEVVANGLH